MTLKEWLTAKDITVSQFANTISRTPEAVRRYVVGDRIPDRETMPLIADATGHSVTPNDFFDLGTSPALCTHCDARLDDISIRACSVMDCPNAQRDAA